MSFSQKRKNIFNNVKFATCFDYSNHHQADISAYILITKPTRCTISQIYFGKELYMFRTVSVSTISSLALYTQHNLCDIHLSLCVQCYTPDLSVSVTEEVE
jgi:hypothetical protein